MESNKQHKKERAFVIIIIIITIAASSSLCCHILSLIETESRRTYGNFRKKNEFVRNNAISIIKTRSSVIKIRRRTHSTFLFDKRI